MRVITEPLSLFKRWYVRPLAELESLPRGDGAFIALMAACGLYERYAVAVLKSHGETGDENGIRARFQIDFQVDADSATAFRKVFRNGLAHEGMPMQLERGRPALPPWFMKHELPCAVELRSRKEGEQLILYVQPWRFVHRVLDLWLASPELLANGRSYPWGAIIEPIWDDEEPA